MIAPRATNEAGCLLAIIIAGRGELDLQALTLRMCPPPKLHDTSGYLAWRAAYQAWEAQLPAARERVSKLLGRLRAGGWVEPGRGAPRVADGLADPFTPADWRRLWAAHLVCQEELDGEEYDPAGVETAGGEHHAAIVARIRSGAASVGEVVGASGSAWSAYRQLVETDVVVPPGRAVASPAGLALVERWRSA